MALSDLAIRKAKPAAKPVKLVDGGGLYLILRPNGSRWWRLDYSRPLTGKRNTLSLGTYPFVGLAEARDKRYAAKKLLAAGIDPGQQRKAEKAVAADRAASSFAAIAEELLTQRAQKLAPGSAVRERRLLEKDLEPYIGSLPVSEVPAPLLLQALRKIVARGAVETAHRARALASQVFRYAIATGRADRNPATDLIGALAQPKEGHFAALTDPAQVGPMLRALHGYEGTPVVMAALKLAPLVFVRPGELRRARWSDINLEAGEWRFTASKTGTPHIVPLATQAVEILNELQPLNRRSAYVFPGIRDRDRPMSDNTVNAALRRMGFDGDTMTGHGFRAMARTILDEVLGFRPDYIEHQLAHSVRDPLGRAYNRATHLPERRKMMQAWADYLDRLREGREDKPTKDEAASPLAEEGGRHAA